MPYRRLPNTDAARLRALQTAHELGFQKAPGDVAYSQKSYTALNTLFPQFRDTIIQHKSNIQEYHRKNKAHLENVKRIKMYISHFIQVVDMAISRGEQPVSIREFYQLSTSDLKLPNLKTDEDLLTWGSKIIEGETARIRQGNSPITNPTIALVKINYEKFLDTQRFQETVKKSYVRSHKLMDDHRKAADKLIQTIWNEIEANYMHLDDQDKRDAAEQYGISYVFRKSESSATSSVETSEVKEAKDPEGLNNEVVVMEQASVVEASEADDHAVYVKPESEVEEIKSSNESEVSESFAKATDSQEETVSSKTTSKEEMIQPIAKKPKPKKKEKESSQDGVLELKLF